MNQLVTITITLHWWYLVVVLAIFPFCYGIFRKKPDSMWDFQLDVALIAIVCWQLAVGLLIGHLM